MAQKISNFAVAGRSHTLAVRATNICTSELVLMIIPSVKINSFTSGHKYEFITV